MKWIIGKIRVTEKRDVAMKAMTVSIPFNAKYS